MINRNLAQIEQMQKLDKSKRIKKSRGGAGGSKHEITEEAVREKLKNRRLAITQTRLTK